MLNFKAQLDRDLETVFHNSAEHADVVEFWIDGTRYKGPVIIDDGGAQDRTKPATDHVDGLVLVDLVMYVPLCFPFLLLGGRRKPPPAGFFQAGTVETSSRKVASRTFCRVVAFCFTPCSSVARTPAGARESP